MKKTSLISICTFLLTLNACQAPGQNLSPEATKKVSYSRAVSAAFTSYTKDSMEGLRQNPQLLSLSSGGAGQSNVPSGATPLVSTFSATSQPIQPVNGTAGSMSSTPSKAPTMEELLKLVDLLKQAIKVGDKANQDMEARLKGLTPPAEMSAQHAKVLDYFRLSHEVCQDMLKLIEGGPTAMAEMANAQGKFKAKLEALKKSEAEVQSFLYQVFMDGYRQDRLALQQGPALSRDAYILSMRALLTKLPASINNPQRLFAEAQASDAGTELKAALSQLAALHPPEDFEESHTVLYASLRLHQEVIPLLQDVFKADADAKNLTQKPIELMLKLLGNADLTGKLLEFATISSKAKEATSRVVKG